MHKLLLISLLLAPVSAFAEVYKWVDEKGVVHYTDKPPTDDAKPATLPPLQTYHGEPVPAASPPAAQRSAPQRKAAAGPLKLTIDSPAHDETIRGEDSAERVVPVSVSVTPGMEEGYRLVYYLDGKAAALPTASTTLRLTGVERGSHDITVSLIDEAGREISRSPTVTIHMKPPTAVNRAPTDGEPPATAIPRMPSPVQRPPTEQAS